VDAEDEGEAPVRALPLMSSPFLSVEWCFAGRYERLGWQAQTVHLRKALK
jgi:hypothetical protein